MQVRISHEFEQTNAAPPTEVFPLLCPVEEAKWVPGWNYRLIYSKSGFAEPGCVFTTPNEDGTDSTWVCTHHDGSSFSVGYVWVRPEFMTARLEIKLEPLGGTQTRAWIRYEYTALSDDGANELRKMDQSWFLAKMKGWEAAINHFLQTGTMLRAN